MFVTTRQKETAEEEVARLAAHQPGSRNHELAGIPVNAGFVEAWEPIVLPPVAGRTAEMIVVPHEWRAGSNNRERFSGAWVCHVLYNQDSTSPYQPRSWDIIVTATELARGRRVDLSKCL